MNTEILKKLMTVQGVSGGESAISDRIKDIIAPYVDECYNDVMGNLIAVKKGTAAAPKKIMLCAHMDEIGFIVTHIEDSGLVRFATIGGINFTAYSYTTVQSSKGVRGVLVPESDVAAGSITFDKCYIDIGAKDKKDAERRVSVGDYFAVDASLVRLMGSRIAGRPMDDRAGCAVLIMIAEKLSGGCADDVYYVFSVQEEVGCRGAKTAAFAIGADVSLTFDVTGTGDTAGAKPMAVKLGGGAAIKIKDMSVICDSEIVDKLSRISKEKNIKSQLEILAYGGTDTSSIQMTASGCRAGAISIPSRYIHSGVEMIDMNDYKACIDLAVEFIKE